MVGNDRRRPINGHLERPALRSLIRPELSGLTVLDAGCGSVAQVEWRLEVYMLTTDVDRSDLAAGDGDKDIHAEGDSPGCGRHSLVGGCPDAVGPVEIPLPTCKRTFASAFAAGVPPRSGIRGDGH